MNLCLDLFLHASMCMSKTRKIISEQFIFNETANVIGTTYDLGIYLFKAKRSKIKNDQKNLSKK